MVFKKGQITIFIIIGIIILISIGVFIYLYQAKVIRPFEEVVVPSVEKAPSEVQPIYDYITACVQEIGKDALKRIGDYGGYADSANFLFNPFSPTSGDAVQFSPDSDLIIPYWWYLKSENDCTGECVFSSMRPDIRRRSGKITIEGQLDEYVNANLKDCLAGFAPFVAQNFEFKELGPVETETTIAKDTVYFLVKYPLRITRGDQSFTVKEYLGELELNFAKIYELATDLVNAESEYGMLEHFTMELIAHFSALDRNMLPPSDAFEVETGVGIIWYKTQVAERLQEILTSYIPLLQAGNTRLYMPILAPAETVKGEPVRDKELYEVLYNRGMIIPFEKDYKDLAVSFAYLPWWKPYFDANCEGEVCMPQSVSTNIFTLLIGIHKYDFAYDVSYPVLVEIRDPDAFKGEGYSFKFFIEANVRNNMPMPAIFEPLPVYEVSLNSMLCDPHQRTSGNVTIFVKDARTQQGIDKALVGYTCGKESCTLGETSAEGVLITRLPRCLGGMLSANKMEYQTKLAPLDVLDNRSLEAEILLEPYRYMDFAVKKYLLGKGATEWTLDTGNALVQAQDEDTIILLNKETSRLEPAFSAFGEVCGMPTAKSPAACGSPPEDNSEHIAVVPGKYHVSIFSSKYAQPPIEIPRDKRIAGSGLTKQEYYIPEDPIIFDKTNPFPSGFAEFEWNLTAEQLDKGDTIEFYYINIALDKVPKSRRKIEDLGEIGKAVDYSKLYRSYMEPRIYSKEREKSTTITVKT